MEKISRKHKSSERQRKPTGFRKDFKVDRPKLLIQGSSWTVGAYEKSSTVFSDNMVSGGLAELLSEHYDVTNISVQDDFNLGTSWRLNEHLKNNHYDKILVCQNDALLDVDVLICDNREWASNFQFSIDELINYQIDTIQKYIEYVLNKFYSQLPSGTYVFAGPSMVLDELAIKNNVRPIQPDWTKCLVPEYVSSFTYNHVKLIKLHEMLLDIFPTKKNTLKEEFLKFGDSIDAIIDTWKNNPQYFAYFHPTLLGNKIFYQQVLSKILINDL